MRVRIFVAAHSVFLRINGSRSRRAPMQIYAAVATGSTPLHALG
jgi:hypothetical protein